MRRKESPERDWTLYMKRAIELARIGEARGDIPIAALVVDKDGQIIAEAHNEREIHRDPTSHAEMLALRRASEKLGKWRLVGCTLVVTLEPCVMCAGALSLSRVDRVVYGAADPKAGAMGSIYKIHEDRRLNHVMDVVSGVCGEECRKMLLSFFRSKRDKS
jgi:tRNA(adenine34) deaminase